MISGNKEKPIFLLHSYTAWSKLIHALVWGLPSPIVLQAKVWGFSTFIHIQLALECPQNFYICQASPPPFNWAIYSECGICTARECGINKLVLKSTKTTTTTNQNNSQHPTRLMTVAELEKGRQQCDERVWVWVCVFVLFTVKYFISFHNELAQISWFKTIEIHCLEVVDAGSLK